MEDLLLPAFNVALGENACAYLEINPRRYPGVFVIESKATSVVDLPRSNEIKAYALTSYTVRSVCAHTKRTRLCGLSF